MDLLKLFWSKCSGNKGYIFAAAGGYAAAAYPQYWHAAQWLAHQAGLCK